MTPQNAKALCLILLVVLPILVAAPTYDAALKYQTATAVLRTHIFEPVDLRNSPPHFVAKATLSIVKHNFADRELLYNWTISISGMNESQPILGLAYLDQRSAEWAIGSYAAYRLGPSYWEKLCQGTGASETCVVYPIGFGVSFTRWTADEWDEFGALNAPMDKYVTLDYYFWLQHSFAFESVDVNYDLPPGYRAGIEGYAVKGLQDIPANLSRKLPAGVGQVCSLRMVVMRDPSSFLPLVLYGTLPLFILWYVGVITLTTLGRREDRLKIYVGALFASFAYFLSLRQLLQTPVSWIEVLAMMGMVLWIVLEAATIAFQGPTRLDS